MIDFDASDFENDGTSRIVTDIFCGYAQFKTVKRAKLLTVPLCLAFCQDAITNMDVGNILLVRKNVQLSQS